MEEVVAGGTEIARAPVFMGAAPDVGVAPAESVEMLLPALLDPEITAEITYDSPLPAPVEAGEVVGQLTIHQGVRNQSRTVPLVAMESVARGGLVVRLRTATDVLLGHALGRGETPDPVPATDG
jgi:D-alanyl-D-alanine carboxypeptidase (penicillin-binding protein 5/6)